MKTLKVFLDSYGIDQTASLDQNNFGSVYRGVEKTTSKEFAIKSSETHPKFDNNLFLERYTKAQNLTHSNLLPYEASYRFENGMVSNIAVMPLMEMGSLDNFWDLEVEDKKLIADQVLDGLYYLHAHGVVWQNLSAKHILLDKDFGNYTPKFINYGNTRKIPLAFFSDYEYLAPEQFDPSEELDSRVDIWALGVLLYNLWVGRLPFGQKSTSLPNSKIQERILGNWEPGLMAQIPEPYHTIAIKCLKREKEARWGNCGEIIAVIKNWKSPLKLEVLDHLKLDDSEPSRKFLRKPNKPIVWWQVVLFFCLLRFWVI
jgi:serine/threonine protein kinase